MTNAIKIAGKLTCALWLIIFSCLSCSEIPTRTDHKPFPYKEFKDSIIKANKNYKTDSSNLFDNGSYTPGVDSLDTLLVNMDSLLHQLKRQASLSPAEKAAINENIRMLDSFYKKNRKTDTVSCRENTCELFAHIIKSKQVMYLYIEGELKDSFLVSTGIKKYKTPDMSVHPRGPVLIKYTSRKFPGGNYKGMGNMPYAVFIKSGYAIHGTTPGNFSKLGKLASHGCIRLHPDNARIFFELVKIYGLSHTWVKITDSL